MTLKSGSGVTQGHQDTEAYKSKNRPFEPTPLSHIALAGGDPLIIFRRHTTPETYITGLSEGEEIMTLAVSVLIQYWL